jgi:hypothetical protein
MSGAASPSPANVASGATVFLMPEIRNYGLPATAICPGCGTMVTLPPEPIFPDSPPSICGTCETEVPDYRRESYDPSAAHAYTPAPIPVQHQAPATTPRPLTPTAKENTKVSRAGLFKALGGILAERGESIAKEAKETFDGISGE